MTPALAVVMHDVAPATLAACERVLAEVRAVGTVPVTLLAVPRYGGLPAGPAFERWLDAAVARGDEIALHGLTHVDEGTPANLLDHVRRRWYTAGEGEFAALPRAEAQRRIEVGRRWFAAHGWPLHGFVAPAWLMSAGTWQAVAAAGFDYTCTLTRLVAPGRGGLRSRAVVYSTRSAWRRAVSLPWNAVVARGQRHRPLLRLELHPADADHPPIRAAWLRLLERALVERRAVTLRQAACEI